MILLAVAIISLIAFTLYSFYNEIRNSHYSFCEAFSDGIKSFFSAIYEAFSNWIYPEHVLNHYAFTHDLVDSNEMIRLND